MVFPGKAACFSGKMFRLWCTYITEASRFLLEESRTLNKHLGDQWAQMPDFTDESIEAQRSQATCPGSQSQFTVKPVVQIPSLSRPLLSTRARESTLSPERGGWRQQGGQEAVGLCHSQLLIWLRLPLSPSPRLPISPFSQA